MTTENAQTKNLNFGDAIAYLKTGYCVAREGWNGKGMFLTLVQGSNTLASALKIGYGEYVGEPTLADTVFMKTADNKLVAWLCSQTDMLAEDWTILAKQYLTKKLSRKYPHWQQTLDNSLGIYRLE